MIRCRCPACQEGLWVPEDDAGSTLNCPRCGHTFHAPGVPARVLDDAPPVKVRKEYDDDEVYGVANERRRKRPPRPDVAGEARERRRRRPVTAPRRGLFWWGLGAAAVLGAALAVADRLEFDRHYRIDAGEQTLSLTRLGREQVARWSGEIPKRGLERAWTAYIEQSLRARWLVRPDIHYLISEGRVQHVDSNTGRVFADRSWREGLEQAIQAREGLTITAETRSLASITRQRYFRVYERLCGLTGTARGTEPEMNAIYGMEIVVIPPHRPCLREALPTLAFPTREAKERAVIAEIMGQSRSGRPLLIGTTTIEASERLARKLTERQVSFRLLNGKRPADEAALVASAGQRGVITLATNMAGRGTDITLGPGVVEMGGLHVIASEPHASTRVDRQLMGRAARQGDPGSCRMFVSAEDDLLAREAPALAKRIRRLAPESGLAHDDFSRALVALQRRHERAQAVLRRRLFEHDDWLASAHDDWLTRETDGGN